MAGAINEAQYIKGLQDAGLTDVEVIDRFVYDEAQLEAFINSELNGEGEQKSCCSGDAALKVAPELSSRIATNMQGKVWSAAFRALKP